MATIVVGLRLLLAVVFLTAAVGKLLDLEGSRRAVSDFGVPQRLARVIGTSLPGAELAVGLALIFRPSARWGALVGLLLLAGFIAGMARALARGEQPDCHCFGQIHSEPVGRSTLIRNGLLAVFALVIVAYGSGPAVDTWLAARSAAELVAIVLGICAVVAVGYALQLRLQVRRLTNDLGLAQKSAAIGGRWGLPVGSPAPPFIVENVRGGMASLDSLLERGRPVLLMFMSPWCGPCHAMLPKVQQWQETLSEDLTIAILSMGTPDENSELVEMGFDHLLLQDQMVVGDAYQVSGTPTAILLSADGKIASRKAEQESAIEPLIRLALRQGAPGSLAGQPA